MSRHGWRVVHSDRDGHRLFYMHDLTPGADASPMYDGKHHRNRVWVADQSGTTPDTTNDGPLEISPEIDTVTLRGSHGHITACVPVRTKSSGASVGLSLGCALWLVNEWGLRLLLDDPTLPAPLDVYRVIGDQP